MLVQYLESRQFDLKDMELERSLKKLMDDGYIYTIDEDEYAISIKGYLFAGYEKTLLLENERLTSIGQMAIATKKYNTRLLWATWCAGIVAALLLLWQVWIWFYPTNKDYRDLILSKKAIVKSK